MESPPTDESNFKSSLMKSCWSPDAVLVEWSWSSFKSSSCWSSFMKPSSGIPPAKLLTDSFAIDVVIIDDDCCCSCCCWWRSRAASAVTEVVVAVVCAIGSSVTVGGFPSSLPAMTTLVDSCSYSQQISWHANSWSVPYFLSADIMALYKLYLVWYDSASTPIWWRNQTAIRKKYINTLWTLFTRDASTAFQPQTTSKQRLSVRLSRTKVGRT